MHENNDFGTNIPAWLLVVMDAPWSQLNIFAGCNKTRSPVARSPVAAHPRVLGLFLPPLIPPLTVAKLQDNCGKSSFCSTNAVRFVLVDFDFAHLFLFPIW